MSLLTVSQAARELGVSGRRVRALIAAGRLPATKLGNMWLIRDGDIAEYRPLRDPNTMRWLNKR